MTCNSACTLLISSSNSSSACFCNQNQRFTANEIYDVNQITAFSFFVSIAQCFFSNQEFFKSTVLSVTSENKKCTLKFTLRQTIVQTAASLSHL